MPGASCRAIFLAALLVAAPPGAASGPDARLARALQRVHAGMLVELQAARLAQQRSRSPAVLAVAQQLVGDDTALDERLAEVARSSGVDLEPALDEAARAGRRTLAGLQRHRGAAFDRAFLRLAAARKARALRALRSLEPLAGDRPALRSLIEDLRRAFRRHRAEVKRALAGLGDGAPPAQRR